MAAVSEPTCPEGLPAELWNNINKVSRGIDTPFKARDVALEFIASNAALLVRVPVIHSTTFSNKTQAPLSEFVEIAAGSSFIRDTLFSVKSAWAANWAGAKGEWDPNVKGVIAILEATARVRARVKADAQAAVAAARREKELARELAKEVKEKAKPAKKGKAKARLYFSVLNRSLTLP